MITVTNITANLEAGCLSILGADARKRKTTITMHFVGAIIRKCKKRDGMKIHLTTFWASNSKSA